MECNSYESENLKLKPRSRTVSLFYFPGLLIFLWENDIGMSFKQDFDVIVIQIKINVAIKIIDGPLCSCGK